MSIRHSLTSRIVIGSLLWTAGLLAITHMVSLALFRHVPSVRGTAHVTFIAMTAVGFMALGLTMVRGGLTPFPVLRSRLASVREGRARRLEGKYPAEVQPLVDDLNTLLDHRDEAVRRALAKAGDLAHGLKTPLAVLMQESDRAQAAGHDELAATIGQQVERMQRQITYHLAHARAAASGRATNARSSVAESADALARTLNRLYAGRSIAIEVSASADHVVRVQCEDLDEMLGNLLDNACKWARSRAWLAAARNGDSIVITVDDDGPGLTESMRDAVLQRGVRADEAAPGSGFGLAIVHDLAELYGGSISLGSTPAGGLRARLELPGGSRLDAEVRS
jgi:signal transduction histidine kinase